MISTLRTNYILQHFLVLSISRTNCIWQYFLVLSILRTNYILQYLLVTHYIGAQALFSASAAAKVVRKEFHFWPQKMSSSKSNAQRVLFSASKISSSKSNAQRVLLWEGAASKVIKTSQNSSQMQKNRCLTNKLLSTWSSFDVKKKAPNFILTFQKYILITLSTENQSTWSSFDVKKRHQILS